MIEVHDQGQLEGMMTWPFVVTRRACDAWVTGRPIRGREGGGGAYSHSSSQTRPAAALRCEPDGRCGLTQRTFNVSIIRRMKRSRLVALRLTRGWNAG